MRLLELHVDRLPGISSSFRIKPRAGINLILGPNESGKSSLVRALQHLLWPLGKITSPFSVRGQFLYRGETWLVQGSDDGAVAWSRDAQPAEKPDLPADHVASCYQLGVLDLVRPTANNLDYDLAREIRTRMAGGYDLDALGKLIPEPGTSFTRQRKNWEQQRQQLQKIILQHKALAGQQAQLTELADEAQRAGRAQDRLALLEAALQRQKSELSLIDLTERYQTFPLGMKTARNDDAENLARHRKILIDLHQRQVQRQAALDQKKAELTALDLPETDLGCDTNLVGRILADGRLLQEVCRAAAKDVAGARARLVREEQNLDPRVRLADSESSTDPRDLFHQLAQLHRVRLALAASLQERQILANETPLHHLTKDNAQETQSLQDAAALINQMATECLRANSLVPVSGAPLWWGAAAFVAGLGSLLATTLGPFKSEVPVLLLAPAILSLMAGFALISGWFLKHRQHHSCRQNLEETCRQLEHPLPASWSPDRVWQLITDLERKITRQETGAEAMQILQKSLADSVTEAESALKRSEEQRLQILDRYDLSPSVGAEDMLAGLNTLERYLLARSDLANADGRYQECLRQMTESEAKARAELLTGGTQISGGLEALSEALTKLEKTRTKRDALLQGQLEDEDQLADLLRDTNREEKQIQELLQRLNLDSELDPDSLVKKLVAGLADFELLQTEIVHQRSESKRLTATLTAKANLLPAEEWTGKSVAGLGILLAQEKELAAGANELHERTTTIKVRIDAARKSSRLADARTSATASHDTLAELYGQKESAALARALLQDVESAFEQTARPRLLAEASDLFNLFTSQRYQLTVVLKNEQQVFHATNTETAEVLELAELSDGTRAQLLLAARLAFINESETGAQPPLFLDESLTASDPVRFAAIAGSLAKLAAESGRQVFYLTSNPADVAAWQQVLQKEKLAAGHLIDLGYIRTGSQAADPTTFFQQPEASIPAPGEMSADQYGAQLKVAQLDPWAPENSAPLFYLLKDDLSLLHRLLQTGATSLGRWRLRPEGLVQAGIMSTRQQQLVAARGQILGAYLEAWRQGRGRPLLAHQLAASEILSGTMLPPAQALLELAEGNAKKFMSGLYEGKVKRLQAGKKDQLQKYLELQGFIDQRDILDTAQVTQHVVQAVADKLATGIINLSDVRTQIAQLDQALTEYGSN